MDSAVVLRAQNGDSEAFEEIVKQHERKIYNLAYRYTGSSEDALDICQETFIKIYRSIKNFKGESSFSTWIYRVASNVCIDYIRKDKKTISLSDDDNYISETLESPNGDPEKELSRKELSSEISKSLLQINEDQREIIVLRDIEGYSYEEIAQLLDISEGTVKSRIARGRKKLQTILINRGNVSSYLTSKDVGGNKNV